MSINRGEREDDDALQREVLSLREQVAELQRAAARHVDTVGISLAEREELLREAERIAHLGTWTWDIGSGHVTWSEEMYRILGWAPGDCVPSVEAFFSAVHPEDRERVQAASEQGLLEGVLPLVDCRIVRHDGTIRYTTTSGLYLFDAKGNPRQVVGGILDRTRNLEAEEKLRRLLGLLEEAQRFAQLGSWRFDPATGELEWSQEFCRIAGLPSDVSPSIELFLSRIAAEDRARFQENYQRILTKSGDFEIEGRLEHSDGATRYIRLQGVLVQSEEGRGELRGTMLDVTEQMRMRGEMLHTQKMEAVGRLAGGIAHDFNNLLTIITGNLEILGDRTGFEPELDDSLRALSSAAGLTRRLLAFGRKAQLMLKLVDPNELVTSTMSLMRRLVGDEIQLETVLAPDLPSINIDPLEMERAIVNLVVNARDVMPSGGMVQITTTKRWEDKGWLVEIGVADNGPGISDSDRPHLFEPFYTTRTDNGGTGLGLATVLGTAEQHGGTVRVAPRQGGGSVFTMVIPAATSGERAQTSDQELPPEAADLKGLRLLVIDDEPMVGDVIRRILGWRGHEVQTASKPEAALALWSEHGYKFDLVICDVAMAAIRGPELIARLAETGVTPQVLFMTGYSEEAVNLKLEHPVLAKPFTALELWRSISSVLQMNHQPLRQGRASMSMIG